MLILSRKNVALLDIRKFMVNFPKIFCHLTSINCIGYLKIFNNNALLLNLNYCIVIDNNIRRFVCKINKYALPILRTYYNFYGYRVTNIKLLSEKVIKLLYTDVCSLYPLLTYEQARYQRRIKCL